MESGKIRKTCKITPFILPNTSIKTKKMSDISYSKSSYSNKSFKSKPIKKKGIYSNLKKEEEY